MNVDIGEIIIQRLSVLPWLDKYAGVVKTIAYKDKDGGKTKKFPAAVQTEIIEGCDSSRYQELCPDSSKKSVLFLEDGGSRFIKKVGPICEWESSFELVCWLNLPLLGHAGSSYSATAIHGIINNLPAQPINVPNKYQRIFITPTQQRDKNYNPFSKYSFDETVNQHLLYPFDYFVLGLDVTFNVDTRCITNPALNSPITCP